MSARVNSHTLSHAENLFSGPGQQNGQFDSARGLPLRLTANVAPGSPDILDLNGIVIATAAALGNVVMDGVLVPVAGGPAVLDVARAIVIDSSGAGDTTQTVTITGTDIAGAVVVENIALNGVTAVDGLKAFKTVTAISIDIVTAGSLTIGTTDIIGLPIRVAALNDVDFTIQGAVTKAALGGAGTLVVADDTEPATAVTGDTRGTYLPSTANDGAKPIILVAEVSRTSRGAFGVPQFTG